MSNNINFEQETDQLYTVAEKAAEAFEHFSTEQVEKIVNAVAEAAAEKAEFYAEWAVRETGYGNVPDKTAKNLASSIGLLDGFNVSEYVEPSVDFEKKIISIPKPAGIVLAPMPCTNPTLSVNFNVLSNLVARNSVILCPHPAAKESCTHAAHFLAEVAENAGAPKGCIQIMAEPNIALVNLLMKDPRTSLIMAIGGPGLVHAAYSSGNPAIGVGAGNVAAYVDSTADIEKAAADVVVGNSFDYGLPCTCESVVLAERAIAAELKSAIEANGGWFAEGEDNQKLRDFIFPDGVSNPAALGKSPQWIGEQSAVSVPEYTKSIVMEISQLDRDEPVSSEKMFPVLGFFVVDGGVDSAIEHTMSMLNMMGKGHSAVIHTTDPKVVVKYASALPVCRIAVNTAGMTGSAGMSTNLAVSGAIGTGFFGGSSTSENIGPMQLVQYTKVAYDIDPSIQMGHIESALMKRVVID
ncbi:MAG: aldehyde dehydrogenase family protein [Colwellia sp.]